MEDQTRVRRGLGSLKMLCLYLLFVNIFGSVFCFMNQLTVLLFITTQLTLFFCCILACHLLRIDGLEPAFEIQIWLLSTC
jgi:hypothetical protein